MGSRTGRTVAVWTGVTVAVWTRTTVAVWTGWFDVAWLRRPSSSEMIAEIEGQRSTDDGAVGGVILAAGRSERMGEPKALLDVAGRTFLAAATAALLEGGCSDVVVVVADAAVAGAAEKLPVTTARNVSGSTQLDSLLVGLAELPQHVTGAVVLPVDHPLVRPQTVRALIDAGHVSSDAIIRPTCGGDPGHPTLFPRALWSLLADPTLPRGARSVVESPETRTVDVEVEDAGVLADIDTPFAYRRLVVEREDTIA